MHHILILVEKATSIWSQPNSFISVEKGYQQNTSIKLSIVLLWHADQKNYHPLQKSPKEDISSNTLSPIGHHGSKIKTKDHIGYHTLRIKWPT